MENHEMKVYLDSLRVGHAYLELLEPGAEHGETYGFYPAKADEKKEVLFGEGMVRKDCDRLKDSGAASEIRQNGKTIQLTEEEFRLARAFVQEQTEKANWYFLIGYNCIDFVQDVHKAAKGDDVPSFLELYSHKELEELSWVGVYARLEKFMVEPVG